MLSPPGRHDLILTADGRIIHLWVTRDANGFLEYYAWLDQELLLDVLA